MNSKQGAVHILRLQEEGGRWSKIIYFLSTQNMLTEGLGSQKSQNLINVVCERPPR